MSRGPSLLLILLLALAIAACAALTLGARSDAGEEERTQEVHGLVGGPQTVLGGLRVEASPAGVGWMEGRLYAGGKPNELVIGNELGRRLHLKVGDPIPPFYQSRSGEKLSKVVGIFRSDVTLWQARLIVTSF